MTTLTLFAIGNALAFALGAYLWSIGKISLGTVYIIFYYTNLLTQPIEQIRMQLQDLQKAGASIQRVEELLLIRPTIADGSGTPLPDDALSVEFRNVTFGYSADNAILRDISFGLQAGKVLGVLGRTGSGKTMSALMGDKPRTILPLLAKAYNLSTEGNLHEAELTGEREVTWRCVAESIDSTNPPPSVLVAMRNVRIVSAGGTRSWRRALMARSLMSDPPGASTKLPEPSLCPARSSLIWLDDPVTGF